MTKKDIEQRIAELEELKAKKNETVENLKIQRATKEAELSNINGKITTNEWINSKERIELEDLQTALRIINQ